MLIETEQIETVLFQALAHPTRRTIIRIAQTRSQGVTYTELITELGLSTGNLNYHLEQLKGILEKNSANSYVLTSFGKKAVEHLTLIEQKTTSEDEKYAQIAAISHKTSLKPIVKTTIIISIAMDSFFMALWAYISYIAIMEGAPIIIYIILPVLFAFGFVILCVLIYSIIKTPLWLKRFEQRFFRESI